MTRQKVTVQMWTVLCVARCCSAFPSPPIPQTTDRYVRRRAEPGPGVEPNPDRHAHCHKHREFLESTPRRYRSYGDFRRVQRNRAPLHTDLRANHCAKRRVALLWYCRAHGARRLVSVENGPARRKLRALDCRAERRRRWRRVTWRGIQWGIEVGMAVLAWRSADGFNATPRRSGVDSLSVNGARHLRLSAQ